jgi:hypothetical protein
MCGALGTGAGSPVVSPQAARHRGDQADAAHSAWSAGQQIPIVARTGVVSVIVHWSCAYDAVDGLRAIGVSWAPELC